MILALAASAIPAQSNPVGPVAVCSNQVWDFGTESQHKVLTNDFRIRNSGDSQLKLIRTIPTCQCAVGNPEKSVLNPGEETAVKVTMRTLTFEGRVTKQVTVVTSDPRNPNLKLTITGEVTPPYTVSPKDLNFGIIGKHDSVTGEFSVFVTDPGAIQVTDVSSSNPFVKVELAGTPEQTEDGRLRHPFEVSLLPGLPVGHIRETITVTTNHGTKKISTVPINASIEGEIMVRPRTFNLGKVKAGVGATRELEVIKSGDANLDIKSVVVSPEEFFDVAVETVTAGVSYKIKVSLKPSAPPRYHRGTLTIKTNVAGEETHKAYFYACVSR